MLNWMQKIFFRAFFIIPLAMLTACGGGGSLFAPPDTPQNPVPASISITASKSDLRAGEEITLTALVKDKSGNAVIGQTLNYDIISNLTGGQVLAATGTTDTSGKASFLYQGGSKVNSDTIRVSTSGVDGALVQQTIVISVTASASAASSYTIDLSAPISIRNGEAGMVTAKVTDTTTGAVIPGAEVSFILGSSVSGAGVTPGKGTTGSDGTASVRFEVPETGAFSGTDTVIASVTDPSGRTAQASSKINVIVYPAPVEQAQYSITLNPSSSNVSSGQEVTLTATVRSASGLGVSGVQVEFIDDNNLSGFTLSSNKVTAGSSGQASVRYTAGSKAGSDQVIAKVTGSNGISSYATAVINVTASQTSIGSLQIISSSPQLSSDGQRTVTITAIIKSTGGLLMKDIPVTFSANNNGSIEVVRGVTDTTGTAVAKLGTVGDKTNRTITVTGFAGSLSGSTTVQVIGTNIVINGPVTAAFGDPLSYILTLRDALANGIPNQTVALSTTSGTLNTNFVVTDAQGQATFTLTANASATITATALNATGSLNVTVGTVRLEFQSPDANADLPISQNHTVTVRLTNAGVPLVGEVVSFTTTRGVITASAPTNGSGDASVTLNANSAGPALVTASYNSVQAQREFQMIATTPASLVLQADPTVVGPGESSTLTAFVRDANQNPVKNATVAFTIDADSTGGRLSVASAVTDAQGKAQTVYTGGSTTSAENGVQIRADVSGCPACTDTESLTVSNLSLFITLGTDNTVAEQGVNYRKTFSVLVTDSRGGPVANQTLTMKIIPQRYFKGTYNWNGTIWEPDPSVADGCANEDLDFDGILDAGEDANGNNRLDPGNKATVSSSTVVTDASGFASVDVVYAQEFANWIEVDLKASAIVQGTESQGLSRFILPVAASDVNKQDVSPPGNPSPFGVAASCGDPN